MCRKTRCAGPALSTARRSGTLRCVTAGSMSGISSGRQLTPQQRQVLAIQAERAGPVFINPRKLCCPSFRPTVGPAMWVLVTIYHRLLRHIEQRNFDVFSARVRPFPRLREAEHIGSRPVSRRWPREYGPDRIALCHCDWRWAGGSLSGVCPWPTQVTRSACWRSVATLGGRASFL